MKKVLLNLKSIVIGLVMANLFLFSTITGFAAVKTWVPTTGGSWATGANWSPAGAPVAGDDVTISANQSAQITNVPNISLLNFTVNGSCSLVSSTSGNVITVTGTFTVATGVTLTLGNGNRMGFTLSATGSGTINGTVSIVSGGTNRVFTNNGNLTIGSAGVINDAGSGGNNSDFVLGTTATLRIGSPNGITTTGTASGNIQVTGARTFPVSSTYIYNGTANQNTGTGLPNNLTGTLSVNNPGFTVTLSAARTIANGGTVNIVAGTFAAGTNLTMASTSTITRSGGTMTGTPAGAGTYNVTYTGNSITTTTELAGTGLNNLTINLTAGQILTLNQSRSIAGTLTLTNNGYFIIPAAVVFTISNGAAIAGGSFGAAKHINTQVSGATQGFIRVNNMALAAYTFPTGNGTSYLPVTVTPSGTLANNIFSVGVFTGATQNGLPNGTPITNKTNIVDAVYTVNYGGAGTPTAPPVNMTLAWPAALEGAGFALLTNPQVAVSHYDGPAWGDYLGSGDNTANTATRTGITTFSPFSVGKLGTAGATLPVKVYYFNGARGNGYNSLYWNAECTSDQVTFDVERSADGKNFASISSITATQQRCLLPFDYADNSVSTGSTLYYRIKITDLNGKISYTSVIRLAAAKSDMQLVNVLPNPVINTAVLNITSTKKEPLQLWVVSMDGKLVQRSTVQLQPGTSIINLDVAQLQSGVYTIKGTFGDGQTSAVKFVKQ